jgi:tRNA(fMet)-specific endonuclease VapC
MSGRYLLDTNIIIGLFAGETSILDNLAQADEVFIPSIALGELYYGARKSKRLQENLERIEDFVTSSVVIECNSDTARQYGDVKNKLRIKGHPLPENDILIAALALQYNLTLVTRDAHFQEIEDLHITAW